MSLIFKSIILEKNNGDKEVIPINNFIKEIDIFINNIRASSTKKMKESIKDINASRIILTNPDIVLSIAQSIWGPEVIKWKSDN